MRITIVRHGQTEFNLSHQVQGWCDSPLLPESIEKAKELGKHFKANNQSFDAFYTSTLNRTIETMKSIQAGLEIEAPINSLDNLREFGFGQAEGLNIDDIWNEIAEHHGFSSAQQLISDLTPLNRCNLIHQYPKFDKAETKEIVLQRIREALNTIVKETKEKGHQNVLVVSHGVAISAIMQIVGQVEEHQKALSNLGYLVINDQLELVNLYNDINQPGF